MLKRLAIIALLGVSLASANNHMINPSDACQAGSSQCYPGKVALAGGASKVVFE